MIQSRKAFGLILLLSLLELAGCQSLFLQRGNQTKVEELTRFISPSIQAFQFVYLDPEQLLLSAQSGIPTKLPFALSGGQIVEKKVRLELRRELDQHLHGEMLEERGLAHLSITPEGLAGALVHEGEGISFLLPLAPVLREAGLSTQEIKRILRRFNHLVYNLKDLKEIHVPVKIHASLR